MTVINNYRSWKTSNFKWNNEIFYFNSKNRIILVNLTIILRIADNLFDALNNFAKISKYFGRPRLNIFKETLKVTECAYIDYTSDV